MDEASLSCRSQSVVDALEAIAQPFAELQPGDDLHAIFVNLAAAAGALPRALRRMDALAEEMLGAGRLGAVRPAVGVSSLAAAERVLAMHEHINEAVEQLTAAAGTLDRVARAAGDLVLANPDQVVLELDHATEGPVSPRIDTLPRDWDLP